MSPLDVDYDMNYLNDDTPPAPGMVKTIGANGKVEWKRFVFFFYAKAKIQLSFSYFSYLKTKIQLSFLPGINSTQRMTSWLQ